MEKTQRSALTRFLTASTAILILSVLVSSFPANATPLEPIKSAEKPISENVPLAKAIGSTEVTLNPSADAYVDSETPDTNYGEDTTLRVRFNDYTRYTYLMFNLADIPPEAIIISARLRLYLTSFSGSLPWGQGSIGAHFSSDNSWTESGITWNNKPDFSPTATSHWSFGILVWTNAYKSWDQTEDVQQGLALGGLTTVLKFGGTSGYAYATFNSKEASNDPQLVVEYSTDPIHRIEVESLQDPPMASNLGYMTIEDRMFNFPSEILTVEGSYQITYQGGLGFLRWDVSGGVTALDPTAPTTTLTTTAPGTLTARGTADSIEYLYDDGGYRTSSSHKVGQMMAVRFTPFFSGDLASARFYHHYVSSYGDKSYKVRVLDENRNDLFPGMEVEPPAIGSPGGWFDVDLSQHDISISSGRDFYIGLEWIIDYNIALDYDDSDPIDDRSWYFNGTSWRLQWNDYMIRAVVSASAMDYQRTWEYALREDSTDFTVSVTTNSSWLESFGFSRDSKSISFNATGYIGGGFCNVSIPKELLGGPFTVSVDDTLVLHDSAENSTHSFLYFVSDHSHHRVEIVGTTVIQEFQPIILPLLIISLAVATLSLKKIAGRGQKREQN